jgi:hypothetical protein
VQAAYADTFTITDTSDNLSFTTSTRVIPTNTTACGNFSLSGEACIVDITAPAANATVVEPGTSSNPLPLRTNILIGGPGESLISDSIHVDPESQTSLPTGLVFGPCGSNCPAYHLVFLSDSETTALSALGNTQTCADFGGCQLTEDGMQDTAGTITWNNGTSDTIVFQSDRETTPPTVPEPSSIMLLLPGLAGVLGARRRLASARKAA